MSGGLTDPGRARGEGTSVRGKEAKETMGEDLATSSQSGRDVPTGSGSDIAALSHRLDCRIMGVLSYERLEWRPSWCDWDVLIFVFSASLQGKVTRGRLKW